LLKRFTRTIQTILVAALLMLISVSAQAQSAASWAAWLYRTDGRVIRLATTGEPTAAAAVIDEILLPLPAGYETYPLNSVSVSPDGQRMAYLAGNATQSQQLVIYDHAQRNISALYDLIGNNGIRGGMPVFSPDSARLVFGYSLIGGGWEIIVIDVNDFAIIDTLRSDDPASVLAGVQTVDVVPHLQRYAADRVNFTLLPVDGSAPSRVDSWLWELPLRRVLVSGAFRSADAALYSPTGEVVMALRDDRLPVGETLLLPDQANTLQVYDSSIDALYPFYHDGIGEVRSPAFAYNGTWIAFEAVTSDAIGWQLVNREGESIGGFGADMQIEDLAPTPDGLIYLARDNTSPTVKLYSLSANAEGALDEALLRYDSESDQALEIVWVGDVSGLTLLGIPPEGEGQWAQLAPPLTGGTVTSASTSGGGGAPDVTVTPELTLRVGGTAVVNTIDGDSLNLRSDTGVEYQIRAKLERGTEVTLLDGPVNADGYNWWLVREPNGVEGWIVDFYGGQITLVPSSIFGTSIVDQMNEAAANPSMVSLLALNDAVTVTLSDPRGSLRLRNGAGLSFRIISMLPNGTRLTVVDGPRESDSLTWWQVRTPEGNVGWAAEIVESERALTKTGTVAPSETTGTEEAPVDTGILAPPIIISPLRGDVLTELPRTAVLEWIPVPGALSYIIEMEACPGVEENCAALPAISGVTGAQHSLNIPADGLYRWRVQAVGEAMTSTSEWSTFIFDTSA
jgi:uncharacterized protein YgiM (DUF1202 family)